MAQGDHTPDDTDESTEPALEDLVRLRVASNETSWIINMLPAFQDAGIEPGDHVEADLLWEDGDPLLLFGRLPEDDVDDARFARKVTDRGSTYSVKPPRDVIEDDPEFGLGLDLEAYDNDDPLCFDVIIEQGVVGLAPLGFESDLEDAFADDAGENTEAAAEPAAASDDPDLVVAEEAVSAAAQATGVATPALRDALATVQRTVDASEVSVADGYERVTVDGRELVVVPDRDWERIGADLDLEDVVLDAVRMAHTRTVEDLSIEAGVQSLRRFSREYDAFVAPTGRDGDNT